MQDQFWLFKILCWIDLVLARHDLSLDHTVSPMIPCNNADVLIVGQQQSVTIMLLTVYIAFLLFSLSVNIYLSDTDSFDLAYGCCYSNYFIWPMFNLLFYIKCTFSWKSF